MRSTRNYVIRVSVVVALAAASLGAAAPHDDVAGWQSLRWRMTETEVRRSVEALGLTVISASGVNETVLRTATRIGGVDCEVVFNFSDDARGLDRVRVRVVDTSREKALAAHAALLRSLTDSYGPPTERLAHGTVSSIARWGFKTTTIDLSLYTDAGVRGHRTLVTLAYVPTAAGTEEGERGQAALMMLFKLMRETWPR